MYAVIKTGGKQYRVQPGDLLVVEKIEGDVGAELSFDQVLMIGGGDGEVSLGAPTIEGAVVRATLIETRKGEKVKVFKKIRRQGYRRTRGHRQFESVLRVTGLEGGGAKETWDGKVDLTPRSVLVARSRGLAPPAETPAAPVKVPARAKAQPKPAAEVETPAAEAAPQKAPTPKAAPKKAETAQKAEAPKKAAPKAATAAKAKSEPAAEAAPKKPRAQKPKADAPEGGEA